ncbi:hypothetical protein E5K00_00390 [Hymenobacter aquaticus]|uniref:Uncharacterized protein n=1 Tax=Hymenobacter aquaticus TaxID=1867101 RepID=A0A4Z0Q1Z4_9BACT|nr:hypothetical protein [Hymenobacter aquaticus]TGE23705.1 hypothetical protein E5K00_00390 [Hymenobacter aquaticus]
MAQYLIKSTDKRTFTLLAGAAVRGELKYTKWFSFKAVLALAEGPTFRIEPRGRWGTTIEVKNGESVVLSFRMHWEGSIVLKSRLGGENRAFVLKSQGVAKTRYVLLDKDKRELLVIEPDYQWNKTNHDYTVSSTELFEALADKDALVLTAIHCANYYMTMMSSLMTTVIATTI